MKYLIAGLGNVGAEYKHTRHNLGFMVLDYLAKARGITFQNERLANYGAGRYRGRILHMIKPLTYVNGSGQALRYWLQKCKVAITHSLVIVDDITLPLGVVRIKAQGGSAGHNGLKNIEMNLSTQTYPRLRIGIASHFARGQQADYVLAPFTSNEQQLLPKIIEQACEVVYTFCTSGVVYTMGKYNRNIAIGSAGK